MSKDRDEASFSRAGSRTRQQVSRDHKPAPRITADCHNRIAAALVTLEEAAKDIAEAKRRFGVP